MGDLDLDGDGDLAVANAVSDDVSVLMNEGDGVFYAAGTYPADEGPYSVAIGDLDCDGYPDLAVANLFSDNVSVLLTLIDKLADCNDDEIPDECLTPVPSQWDVPWSDVWTAEGSWCPPETPNNGGDCEYPDPNGVCHYRVEIAPLDVNPVAVRLNISPTIDSLVIAPGATLEVNGESGATVRAVARERARQ